MLLQVPSRRAAVASVSCRGYSRNTHYASFPAQAVGLAGQLSDLRLPTLVTPLSPHHLARSFGGISSYAPSSTTNIYRSHIPPHSHPSSSSSSTNPISTSLLRPSLTRKFTYSSTITSSPRYYSTSPFTPLYSTAITASVNSDRRPVSVVASSLRLSRFKQQARACSARRHGKMCGSGRLTGAGAQPLPPREILPANVKPTFYKLVLEPHFDDFTFHGQAVIDLAIKEPSRSITLNCAEIEIQTSAIKYGDRVIEAVAQEPDLKKERITFDLSEELPAGAEVKFEINFTGILNNKLAGFYRSEFKTKDGETHHIATTQMEPTDARRAFPCWDEPSLKAEFEITLIAEDRYTCLSNMDVKEETQTFSLRDKDVAKKAVQFNSSPIMSTYLVAFIVGEFNYIETNKFRIPIRVYAPINMDIEEGRMSLELAASTLDFYEAQFDSDLPLPKMDMISIPDFSAGAMENWGLITYRTADLLLGKNASSANIQRVAETVQHELAHQWFGNLVTMDYWDGLWLNEGFATWMSWHALDHFHRDWKIWEAFVSGEYQSALSRDSSRSSHPVEVPIQRASQVNEIFDAISYSKGSCVLRMIASFLGEDVFLSGVRRYISRHSFGNTVTDDLWDALSAVSGKDVGKIMSIWTKNTGFPVVSVTEDEVNKSITVQQNRFLASGDVVPEEDTTLYPVMLSILTADGVKDDILFDRKAVISLSDLEFYKLNKDYLGFYRTVYPNKRLQSLAATALDGRFSEMDRIGFMSDITSLANAGYYNPSTALSTIQKFKDESSSFVWDGMLGYLSSLKQRFVFDDPEIKTALTKLTQDLTKDQAKKLGWEYKADDSHIMQQFRTSILYSAAKNDNPEVLGAMREMFEKYKAGDRDAINPNLKATVFLIMVSKGGAEEYKFFKDLYLDHTVPDRERDWALRALGFAESPELIKETLKMTLSKDVKRQDVTRPLVGLHYSRTGSVMLWEWFRDNYDEIVREIPTSLSSFSSVIELSTSMFTTQERLDELKGFFAGKDTEKYTQSLEQSLETIKTQSECVKRERTALLSWLRHAHLYAGESGRE